MNASLASGHPRLNNLYPEPLFHDVIVNDPGANAVFVIVDFLFSSGDLSRLGIWKMAGRYLREK